MEQKLNCETIKDLMPLYVDKLTSEATNQAVKEHLEECTECRNVLEQMKQNLEVVTAPEVKEFSKYMRRSRLSIVYWIMGISALIAVVTCVIVNFATEGRLTWSWIVTGGIVTAYFPLYVALKSETHRFIKFIAVLNLCSILLLGLIQVVLYYFMRMGTNWFEQIGLPIALLWSAIIWAGIYCNRILRCNVFLSLGIAFALSVFGNTITNMIIGNFPGWGDTMYYVQNGLGLTIAAAVFLFIGVLLQMRKRK